MSKDTGRRRTPPSPIWFSAGDCSPWSAGRRPSPVGTDRSSSWWSSKGGNYDRTWVKSRPSPSGSIIPSASTSGASSSGRGCRKSCLRHEFSLMSLCTAILVSCVPFTELLSSRYRFVASPGQTPRPATPRKVAEVISARVHHVFRTLSNRGNGPGRLAHWSKVTSLLNRPTAGN